MGRICVANSVHEISSAFVASPNIRRRKKMNSATEKRLNTSWYFHVFLRESSSLSSPLSLAVVFEAGSVGFSFDAFALFFTERTREERERGDRLDN